METTSEIQTRQPSKFWRVLNQLKSQLALLIIFHLAIFGAVNQTEFALENFNYPYQLDESEGMIAAEVRLLNAGVPIFNTPGPQQFIAAPYPPLYYLLNAPLVALTGADYSLKVGRAITLFFTLVAAIAIWMIVHTISRNRLAAFASFNLWLASGLVGFWGGLVKPDVPAIAFGLLGLWWVLHLMTAAERLGDGQPKANREKRKWVLAAQATAEGEGVVTASSSLIPHYSTIHIVVVPALLFFAANFTKQTSVAAAGAGLLGLLLWRWRSGVAATAVYLGLTLGSFLLLNLLTDGGYWWHILTVHNLPWNGDRAAAYLGHFLDVNWPLLVLAGAGFFVTFLSRWRGVLYVPNLHAFGKLVTGKVAAEGPAARRLVLTDDGAVSGDISVNDIDDTTAQPTRSWIKRLRVPIVVLAYFVASAVQSVGVGTLGGNHNHMLDVIAAGSIGAGLLLAWLALQWERGRLPVQVAAVTALAVVAVLVYVQGKGKYDPYAKETAQLRPVTEQVREGMTNIGQYVTNAGGPAFSTNVSVLLAARLPIPSTDPYTQRHATEYGRWDESQLLADIRARRYRQIILPGSVPDPCRDGAGGAFSPGIGLAVCENYRLDQRNVENIFVPK